MKECVQRTITLDERYRMSAAALEAGIQADLSARLNPWMIVASAGTTDTGAVDPLDAIADIAQQYGLWMQTDGAYGGVFALLDYGKRLLKGIERSDAVVINPHKGLFLPYGSGAILVRNGAALKQAHRYSAHYLQDEETLASGEETSPADLSPELTRHFRGLRLWLPLKLLGVAPFRAALEEKLLLARYFYDRIQEIDGFETGPYPDLSVVAFRYLPKHGDADALNRALVLAVQRDGRTFLSSTTIDGVFMLRVAVLSFRTHLEQIDTAIEVLQEKVRELESD
jgi:glutamate/tyrosine decarboxylase-like PLP-dependent enzyme